MSGPKQYHDAKKGKRPHELSSVHLPNVGFTCKAGWRGSCPARVVTSGFVGLKLLLGCVLAVNFPAWKHKNCRMAPECPRENLCAFHAETYPIVFDRRNG